MLLHLLVSFLVSLIAAEILLRLPCVVSYLRAQRTHPNFTWFWDDLLIVPYTWTIIMKCIYKPDQLKYYFSHTSAQGFSGVYFKTRRAAFTSFIVLVLLSTVAGTIILNNIWR